nr:peptidyl-prolyl cis-trans isomerase FKBP20-2, chloroplastic [Tanacetum cinerariifolium]
MLMLSSSPYLQFNPSLSYKYRSLTALPTLGKISIKKKSYLHCCSSCNLKGEREQNGDMENVKRRRLLVFLVSTGMLPTLPSSGKTKAKNPYDEKRLLEQNKRVQRENNAPDDFPSFVREGFEVKVVASENYVRRDSGLIYRDFEVGSGDCPKSGQQVTFHYIGYNESGRRIDSSYQQGTPGKIRMGTNALVPGFEEGIKDMKPGGKRRIIIPPELGPPVGPSTFFSAKQFEVFDVELLGVKDCKRRTIAFYSDVVCD